MYFRRVVSALSQTLARMNVHSPYSAARLQEVSTKHFCNLPSITATFKNLKKVFLKAGNELNVISTPSPDDFTGDFYETLKKKNTPL